MDNQTFWQALQVTQAVVGGVSFINSSGAAAIDINNLYWDINNHRLSVNTSGDMSGSDTINTYFQQDSYLPYSQIVQTADSQATPGHTTSSSQGSGLVPTYSLAGDPLGQFSGWGYTGTGVISTYSYRRMAGIEAYTAGAAANAVAGLGGELRFGTKLDNGIYTNWWKLNNLGQLAPMVNGAVDLGAAAYGIKKVFFDYTNTGTIGAVTINKAAGRVNIAAGQTTAVVTNSLATVNSLVLATIQQNDATAIIKNVVPAAGSITINLTAAATANTAVGFLIVSTDA